MNTIEFKNEIADIVCRYLRKHPATCRRLKESVLRGRGEEAMTLIIIAAIKAAKGGKYPQYAESFEELIEYLETKLCMTINVDLLARKRRLRPQTKINRLAILIAYLVEARRTGGYMPPEMSVPELAIFWSESR